MSTSTQPSAPRRAVEPTILWDEVVKARAVVAQQRHLPSSRTSSIARAELLSALEAYVKSLTNQRRPIPYGLRDELRIRRLTRHTYSLRAARNPGVALGHLEVQWSSSFAVGAHAANDATQIGSPLPRKHSAGVSILFRPWAVL